MCKLNQMPCLACFWNVESAERPIILDLFCSNCMNGDSFEPISPDVLSSLKARYLGEYNEQDLINCLGGLL